LAAPQDGGVKAHLLDHVLHTILVGKVRHIDVQNATVRDAAVAGAGAAMLPQSIIGGLLERGELVSWGAAGNEVELWVLHTSRRLQSPKVRAFVEFICNYYPNGSFVVQE
tara:strand:+ start:302 stop:631 length:330 start_codon:yes stop_codon:yes gene_type:complete